jgi:CRISPR/Cas system-associated endonuclease/helicase Cas3
LDDPIKEDEMGGGCNRQGKDEKYIILVGKAKVKKPLRRTKHKLEDNIKM